MKNPSVITLRNQKVEIPKEFLPFKKEVKAIAALTRKQREQALKFAGLLAKPWKAAKNINRLMDMGSFLSSIGLLEARFFYEKAYKLAHPNRNKK